MSDTAHISSDGDYTGNARSPGALAFIAAVDAVCQQHGYTIEHQDHHGAFEIVCGGTDREWFQDAHEIAKAQGETRR